MMVEPIDFMFWKDAFKTTKASRDFIDVIKLETSNSNREEDDWTTRGSQAYLKSCGYSSINGLVGTKTCDFTGGWENAMNIKICSAVFQVWGDQSKKIMEKAYLQKHKIRRRIFSTPERMTEKMMQISIWNIFKYFIVYFIKFR